jgi:hypothetical protein
MTMTQQLHSLQCAILWTNCAGSMSVNFRKPGISDAREYHRAASSSEVVLVD